MDMSAGDDDESVNGVERDKGEESDEEVDADAAASQLEDDHVRSKCYSNQHGI